MGILASIVGWKPESAVGESTWGKFIHGKPISEKSRDDILREVVERLVPSMSQEERTFAGQVFSQESSEDLLHEVLVLHARWWDELCARLQSTIPMDSTEFINMAVLRLAVVELAVRLGALWFFMDPDRSSKDEDESMPFDAEQILLPMLLRKVLKKARITRQKLAEELGVTKEAVDQWLARTGEVPVERLDQIADVVDDATGVLPDFLKVIFRLARAWTRLLRGVSDRVAPEEPDYILKALWKMLPCAMSSLKEQLASVETHSRMLILMRLMMLGSECEPGPTLRQAMLDKETDDGWKSVISTPMRRWVNFLANALLIENQARQMKEVQKEEGFSYLWTDEERIRNYRMIGTLITRERLLSFLGPDFRGTPEQVLDWTTGLLLHCGSETYEKSEGEKPEAWRFSMEIAESSRIHVRSAQNEHQRLRWNVLTWLGYAQGIALLLSGWSEVSARDDSREMVEWLKRIPEVHRSIPPLPTQVASPSLRAVLDMLRLNMSHLECLSAMGEMFELKLEFEDHASRTVNLKRRITELAQAGREPETHDLEEISRVEAFSANFEERWSETRTRLHAKEAQRESLSEHVQSSLAALAEQPPEVAEFR